MSRATEMFAQFPARIADTIDAAQVILLVRDANGVCGISSHGLASHAEALLLMCSGVHMLHREHDEQVLAGAAGAEAQARLESLIAERH